MQSTRYREKLSLPELLYDRSRNKQCPKDSETILLKYVVGAEDFFDGQVPALTADKNHFREFPCRYCTWQERKIEVTRGGTWNEFNCALHKGKVIELGILDYKELWPENMPSNSSDKNNM
jgi:hypothetical protein